MSKRMKISLYYYNYAGMIPLYFSLNQRSYVWKHT
jgi:hypothetical protein